MAFLVNQQVVGGAVQPLPGVYDIATNAFINFLVEDLSFSFVDEKVVDRNAIHQHTIGMALEACNVTRLGELSFNSELKGSGVLGVAPAEGILYRISGMDETIIATTSVTYSLSSSPQIYGSFVFIYGDRRIEMYDCTATRTLALQANTTVMESWTVKGRIQSNLTGSLSPSYSTVKPQAAINLDLEIGGVSLSVNEFNIDFGIENPTITDLSTSDGFSQPQITKRKLTATINPLLSSTFDWETQWSNNYSAALTLNTIGSVAGNRCQIVIPNAKPRNAALANRDERIAYQIELELFETATGNDEIMFVFT